MNSVGTQKHFRSRIISDHNKHEVVKEISKHVEGDVGSGNVWYQKIDNKREVGTKVRVNPDYYLRINLGDGNIKTWTLLVKTTYHDTSGEEELYVKAAAIHTCKKHTKEFPNPYLVYSNKKLYKLIPMHRFWLSRPLKKKFKENEKDVYYISLVNYESVPYGKQINLWRI